MIRAYLDNNATTKPAPEVVAAMMPYFGDLFPNPSSIAGRTLGIDGVVSDAKRALARLLGSVDLANGLVLTSGASEANSWAISGAVARRPGAHVVASAVEHASVLAACRHIQDPEQNLSILKVDGHGVVDREHLIQILRADTAIVSIMLANNETGAIQPMAELCSIVRSVAPSAMIHCDATQAVGKIPIDLDGNLSEIDLLSLSAHKFHGPKGIGALYIRPMADFSPLIHGEQEGGLRGGTLNSAAAAGLAKAAELAIAGLAEMRRVSAWRDSLEDDLCSLVPGMRINTRNALRLPNTISATIDGVDADALTDQLAMRGVFASTGSACSFGSQAPSHVLTAMGLSYAEAKSTVRLSLSRQTTMDEIEIAISEIIDFVNSVR